MPFGVDAIDRQIVAVLCEDGRISSSEIMRRIGHVSERAVRYRIDRLIRNGVIRVSAVVDPQVIGFTVTADVIIEVAPGYVQSVAAAAAELPNVSYVAGSVGDGDVSIQVYARDNAELLRIVEEQIGRVSGVTRTRTVMVPWKLKDAYQWAIPETVAAKGGRRATP